MKLQSTRWQNKPVIHATINRGKQYKEFRARCDDYLSNNSTDYELLPATTQVTCKKCIKIMAKDNNPDRGIDFRIEEVNERGEHIRWHEDLFIGSFGEIAGLEESFDIENPTTSVGYKDPKFYKLKYTSGQFGWVSNAWLSNQKRRLSQTDLIRLNHENPRWLEDTGSPEANF